MQAADAPVPNLNCGCRRPPQLPAPARRHGRLSRSRFYQRREPRRACYITPSRRRRDGSRVSGGDAWAASGWRWPPRRGEESMPCCSPRRALAYLLPSLSFLAGGHHCTPHNTLELRPSGGGAGRPRGAWPLLPSKKARTALSPGIGPGAPEAVAQALAAQPAGHCLLEQREGSVADLHNLSLVDVHLAGMGMRRLELMPRGAGSSLLHAFAAELGSRYEDVRYDAVLEVCRNPTAAFIGMICEAFPDWPEVQAYTSGVLQDAATVALAGAVSPPTDEELRMNVLHAYAVHMFATDVPTPGFCPGELELSALLSCHPRIGWAAVLSAGPGGELSPRFFGNTRGGGSGITLVLSGAVTTSRSSSRLRRPRGMLPLPRRRWPLPQMWKRLPVRRPALGSSPLLTRASLKSPVHLQQMEAVPRATRLTPSRLTAALLEMAASCRAVAILAPRQQGAQSSIATVVL